jgi:hypothetical protein
MAELYKTYEVRVVAEYWATFELEVGEEKSEEELKEMAWKEFYDTAYRASIEETKIESEENNCADCNTNGVEDDHECEEEEEE